MTIEMCLGALPSCTLRFSMVRSCAWFIVKCLSMVLVKWKNDSLERFIPGFGSVDYWPVQIMFGDTNHNHTWELEDGCELGLG